MAQVINTNSLSLITQNNLNKSQSALNSAIERLSSGMRINSAKDDAAGQAIANRFTANINGLKQATRNANDGISIAQTTEGALTEVNNNLQRIRELSVQAATGTNSASDLDSIQSEIGQRLDEINRVSDQTQFNGVKVLSADAGKLTVQVGANDGETIDIDLKEISAKTLGLDGFNVNNTGSKNKTATASDLLVAGFTAGATTNGVTSYSRTLTTAANGATANDVLAKMQDGGTVTMTGGATYTYSAATKSYTATEAARSQANTLASLTPPAGTSVTATVKLGNRSMDVKIDSNGAMTDAADGSALYLDGSKNLTKTGAGATSAATLSAVLEQATGMSAAGDSITIGATGASYTVVTAAAGASTFAVAGERATADQVAAKINAGAGSIDIDGAGATAPYVVAAAGGAVTGAYIGVSGLTTTAAESINLNANGVVTDAQGSVVYADSAKPGKLTTNAVSNAKSTVDPLKALDAALSKVDKLRSSLGAVQNRFDSVIANLGTTVTNLSSSRSRIQDADYAVEVSNMTRAQILQQAGTSVLSQANQTTQGVLSLLR
ncbi:MULTISPECIES: FliC/FljB family flagellin [unclassified Variovorax]|jgi:flagellin|uniref:FliC/FljB family flagellin n=1 Tax=unclassified Variovorax TaxID=663243 RepID=UPI000F7D7BA5|nr:MULTISPECIES: FliC/FljB family flagellin [unclassified Variovorax]RSZ47274.1 FliC/FljB family flagellin [Variovorax sp. 553]RSZ48603.1 FliC/FljB family flagellin [Variovorax sp. 679]